LLPPVSKVYHAEPCCSCWVPFRFLHPTFLPLAAWEGWFSPCPAHPSGFAGGTFSSRESRIFLKKPCRSEEQWCVQEMLCCLHAGPNPQRGQGPRWSLPWCLARVRSSPRWGLQRHRSDGVTAAHCTLHSARYNLLLGYHRSQDTTVAVSASLLSHTAIPVACGHLFHRTEDCSGQLGPGLLALRAAHHAPSQPHRCHGGNTGPFSPGRVSGVWSCRHRGPVPSKPPEHLCSSVPAEARSLSAGRLIPGSCRFSLHLPGAKVHSRACASQTGRQTRTSFQAL